MPPSVALAANLLCKPSVRWPVAGRQALRSGRHGARVQATESAFPVRAAQFRRVEPQSPALPEAGVPAADPNTPGTEMGNHKKLLEKGWDEGRRLPGSHGTDSHGTI